MPAKMLADLEEKMKRSLEHTRHELAVIRTGRANPALVEDVKVDYYGVPTPLKQMASITVPDPRTIVVEPWDKGMLKAVEKAIQASGLGLNPSNDGRAVKVPLPPLSAERREELVKLARKKAEEGRVAIRNLRRDAVEECKRREKEGTISEDESKKLQKEIQELTDRYIKKVDELLEHKEREIREE